MTKQEIRKILGANIKKFRELNNYTQLDLVRKIFERTKETILPSYISSWEKGKFSPSIDTLKVICDIFGITLSEIYGEANNDFGASQFDNIRPIGKQSLPVLGEVACGKPIFTNEDIEFYIENGKGIQADFILIAKGDSMINANIRNGDLVFIKKQEIVDNGEIACVLIGDSATLKRVYYYPDKNKLVLNAENPAFEPMVYVGEELNDIKILGKAIAFQSLIR